MIKEIREQKFGLISHVLGRDDVQNDEVRNEKRKPQSMSVV